jgi:XTP/dITP diphosphohydrolase
MIEWVLATSNKGKARELRPLIEPLGIHLRLPSEFGMPDAEETGLSFVENAILKARHASRHAGLPAVADDSGLEVKALDGAPGIFSARFAGPDASDRDNLNKLLQTLGDNPERRARFVCVLAFVRHPSDPTPEIFTGYWHGRIAREARGDGGFGYDPVFVVRPDGTTAAELSPEQKSLVSHRGRALAKFRLWLAERNTSF